MSTDDADPSYRVTSRTVISPPLRSLSRSRPSFSGRNAPTDGLHRFSNFERHEERHKKWLFHHRLPYLNSVVSNRAAYAYVRIHLFHLFLLCVVFKCVRSVRLRRSNLAQRVYVFCDPAGCRFHHLKLFTSEWSMATISKHHETSERHAVILAL